MAQDYTTPKCSKCGRHSCRFRTDGSYHCLKCGYDSAKEKIAEK